MQPALLLLATIVVAFYDVSRASKMRVQVRRIARGSLPPGLSAAAPPPIPVAPLDWSFKPVQVKVDLDRENPSSVPVLVVPVPVPTPGFPGTCDASIFNKKHDGRGQLEDSPVQQSVTSERRPQPSPPADQVDSEPSLARFPPPIPDSLYPVQSYTPDEESSGVPARFEPIFSSKDLIKEFRVQAPKAPELPPMLLSGFDASERQRIPDGGNPYAMEVSQDASRPVKKVVILVNNKPPELSASSPPPAYFPEALRVMRGKVTVPRADYTEPYAVWFDETTGNSRIDFHGGSTSTFRTTMPDGQVRRAVVWVQRSSPINVRRCGKVTTPQDFAPVQHPALPDLTEFTFSGTEKLPSGIVEVWIRTVEGRPGEHGAAPGEALTTYHEMKLTRLNGGAVPVSYTVSVDSSTLGRNCDGYIHEYQPQISQPLPPDFFDVDLDKFCDTMVTLDASSAKDVAKLEPLREFTLPHRDERYTQVFDDFRAQYARQYGDEMEEAVRKNVLMQGTRFVLSGNRQGATSELGATLLADRLQVEIARIMGGRGSNIALAIVPKRESFPYSREEVRKLEKRLPTGFDWRSRGAVSPVQFQGATCMSCWAFAVTGALEGALFQRTHRLVPLSFKSLIDCAHPFGGLGCSGTWPSHAYNYVQERGIPALDEYPQYNEKVDQCMEQHVPSQTRISGHVNVTTNSVPALKIAIKRHGPNVVQVDSDCKSFIFHTKGVLYDDRCGKALGKLQHAVLAVGWGEERGEPHFILKNSWSDTWGEKGYIKVHARSNTCGVLTIPSYPVIKEDDVRQPPRAGSRAQRSQTRAAETLYDQVDPEEELFYDY